MGAGFEDLDPDQPSYPAGVPNPHKFGFIPIGAAGGGPMADADEAIVEVGERLGRPVRFFDEDGYEREITAGAVHPGTTGSLGSSIGAGNDGTALSTSSSG